jgi:hypothetical protein
VNKFIKFLASITLIVPLAHANELVLTPIEVPCGKTKDIVQALTEAGERPQYMGNVINSNDFIQIIWVSDQDQTASITHSKGDLTCVVSMGTNVRKAPRRPNS